MRWAVISGEIRELARGPSGMLMALTPRSRNALLLATVALRSYPRGGTSSTVLTHWRRASRPASRDFSARAAGSFCAAAVAAGADAVTGSLVRARLSGLTARTISRICSGVVPQQPPTADAPRSTYRLAYVARYSGEQK